jgi:tetratricopeptide (TPR) repeat protein
MRILKLIAVAVALLNTIGLSAQVRVWQGTLTLPTYEEGLPDPNPPFDQFTTNRFNYPYTLRTNLTSRRVNHNWRAIFIENEYLKCSVLPDIGGHLYTCIDKISGKPMFYANPSIKKAAIAYRGAWAAFGIEFNFPVSHNWMTMSPVNFSYSQHEDGSASATIGNIDRVYGMEWNVELILRPGSTVLEQQVTLSNRSDVRHRFYWWNNAGIEAWDDSRIEYPMRFTATHGFTEIHRWPVDYDGVDYSILGNHKKGPVSMFAHGSREGFMGVWNPHSNSGTVHYARYEDLPAKKIWSWGVDADGLDWRKALSDNNSAYLEVQAGLFRNQETYAFLEPRQVIRFSEYWMPVREIGGISRANLSGVASLHRAGNKLIVGFNANKSLPQSTVTVRRGKEQIIRQSGDLNPARAWIHEIQNPDAQSKYSIEVSDRSGTTLLRQTEGEYDWAPESDIHLGPQTSYRIPDSDHRTNDDWVQLGKDEELNGRLLNASDTYQKALAKFPNSYSATKAAGRLSTSLLRFEEAKKYLEPLQARDTTDGELSYYLALAYEGLGDFAHARSAYEATERLQTFKPAAALRLGELLSRTGDMEGALRHLEEAARLSPNDARAQEEFTAISAAAGKLDRARLSQLASRFPTSNLLREELGNPNLNQLANDPYRILNLASEYIRLGLYQKAVSILSRNYPAPLADQSEPGTLSPQKHPMIAYFRGYCREKLGQSPAADFAAASSFSSAYVFPSTAIERDVLQAALKANPQDGTAHYLLGTLYFSRGLTDDALNEWSDARKYSPNLPVLSASTGLALLHIKNEPAKALAAFRDGLRNDPENIAVYLGIDQSLSLLKSPAQERVDALSKFPHLDAAPPSLIFELILNLAEAGDFDRANSLFHNRFFPREEGGTNVRQVWVEVQLQHAVVLAKANNCGAALDIANNLGSPVQGLEFTRDGLEPIIQSARTNYLLANVFGQCGKPELAKERLLGSSTATAPDQLRWAALAAGKLPNYDRGEWQKRLKIALEQAQSRSETSQFPSWWMYSAGLLARDLGDSAEAESRFHRALLLPDRMLAYHFTRLATESAAEVSQ